MAERLVQHEHRLVTKEKGNDIGNNSVDIFGEKISKEIDQLYLTLKVITVCVLLTESTNQLQN
jgi:hypothetical protein